jgi:hypothetical protein
MLGKVRLITDRANAVIEIGRNTAIPGSCIHAYLKIYFGENCLIAQIVKYLTVRDITYHFPWWKKGSILPVMQKK